MPYNTTENLARVYKDHSCNQRIFAFLPQVPIGIHGELEKGLSGASTCKSYSFAVSKLFRVARSREGIGDHDVADVNFGFVEVDFHIAVWVLACDCLCVVGGLVGEGVERGK